MEKINIATLEALYQNNNSKRAFIILHGYGASMDDLAPLHEYIAPGPIADFYFLNGIEDVDFGPFMPPGKAWFHIDMEMIQGANAQKRIDEYFNQRPAGFDKASNAVKSAIDEIKDKYDEIVVGGFSQGSMIAANVAFEYQDYVKGLIIMSGTFVDKNLWDTQIVKNKELKIFQSHGFSDPVLPFSNAEKLASYLKDNFTDSAFIPFQGGHEIPMEVIQQLNLFIETKIWSRNKI